MTGAAEDLWHLSIDDLFVAPAETPPLEGLGPFVINLSASTAPITIPATGPAGFEKFKLYQLSRKEDGRDRFRLRLGFFDTPAAANEALAVLREQYPSAFASNAAEEDHRFNPARARPAPSTAAAPATPLPQAAPTTPHVRGAVRTDSGRRGNRKRDIRRDHGSQARAGEEHGPQRHKQSGRPSHGSNRSTQHVESKKAGAEEKLDVESILLAALAPAAPRKPPQHHAPKAAGSAKQHQRPHAKAEPKPAPAEPSAKSAGFGAIITAPTLGTSAPASAPAPTITYSVALAPSASDRAKVATPETPKPSRAPAPEARTPEPVQTPVVQVAAPIQPVADARAPVAAPSQVVDEAQIATHPRIDDVPVAAHRRGDEAQVATHPRLDEAPNDAAEHAADVPIDLHFIDRIFDDKTPSDDDTPTVEVLALESPDASPVQEKPASQPAAIVEAPKEELATAPKEWPAAPKAKVSEPPKHKKAETKARAAETEAPTISAHEIIALLTQPLPVARPVSPRSKSEARVKRGHAPSVPAKVAPQAAPRAPANLAPPPPVNIAPQAPAPAPEPKTASASQSGTPVARSDATQPPQAPNAEPDSSVGAMSARIESELDAIMSPTDAPQRTRDTSKKPAVELELELEPQPASVPVLSDIIEEVTVAAVIPIRHEQPPSKPAVSAAEATPMSPAAPRRAATRAPESSPAPLPADSIFKVKSRPVEAAKTPAPAVPEMRRPVVVFDAPIEDMDSTQTLRALTPLELTDDSQSKWFAVQLALSEEQVKVESLPHIDIFDEYRLYSISGIDQAKFMHSLRLGFFSAEGSAQAVAGYLRTFFEGAAVKRVSIAEHERFCERRAKVERPAEADASSAPAQRTPAPGASSPATPAHGSADDADAKTPVRKRGSSDSSPTGRHKTLGEALYEEARQVALSQSAIRRLPKNSSLWSKLFGQGKG
ncbi:MAG TPA: hypothetical protein VEZ88_07825 [Steroidobacteraceae bacterium]|nr:hypothetical protein [Steroidobacteraceae bacterium]